MITFNDFKKLDIRIGKIVSAEKLPDTDKLITMTFDFGIEQRQIIASLAEYYPDPQALVGKAMPVLLNLAPKDFKGYTSHGMLLAVDDGTRPYLLMPEAEVKPGSIVR